MQDKPNYDESNQNINDIIYDCLNIEAPKSFFLFAGAGSGKTRSLVDSLNYIRRTQGEYLRINRKKVAVITYTNAACDEIKHRIEYDPLFYVGTIHSFVWELINKFQSDIREWLRIALTQDIQELTVQVAKGRPNTKTAIDRQNKIQQKNKRLINLDTIRQFSYNPTGDNRTRDSLNHSEVIQISSDLLKSKPLMQEILIQRFPILFIDESQDTKKDLIEAFFNTQANYNQKFCLGLFGDTMQRIYSDGKEDLGRVLPSDWVKPAKKINYRCPKRVVTLINNIRRNVDQRQQIPKENQIEGHVRVFISQSSAANKSNIETNVLKAMADSTNDELWSSDVKILILEHHMAAKRMGFANLFDPLYKCEPLRQGLLDGTQPGLRFFSELILPLRSACLNNDSFSVARIVKKYSPLITDKNFRSSGDQLQLLKSANDAVQKFNALWDNDKIPSLLEIIWNIQESSLFILPENFALITMRNNSTTYSSLEVSQNSPDEEEETLIIQAWDEALNSSFIEIEKYNEYISDQSKFGTHQGVKGLEFPRVMLILDDEDARGFLFSYEKLFGVKDLSETDIKNQKESKETSIDRTLRLFYVACSRAEKSLALVIYTKDPDSAKQHMLTQKWFNEDELIMI